MDYQSGAMTRTRQYLGTFKPNEADPLSDHVTLSPAGLPSTIYQKSMTQLLINLSNTTPLLAHIIRLSVSC